MNNLNIDSYILQFDGDFYMTDKLPKNKYEKQLIKENNNIDNIYYIVFHDYDLLNKLTNYIHHIILGKTINHIDYFDKLLNNELLDIFYYSESRFNQLINNKNILYENRYDILNNFLKNKKENS